MDECDQIPTCSFFQRAMAEMPTIAEMMKERFCHGDFASCARRMVLDAVGKDQVPVDLAPNDRRRATRILGAAS